MPGALIGGIVGGVTGLALAAGSAWAGYRVAERRRRAHLHAIKCVA
jgi:gas vesicle protein